MRDYLTDAHELPEDPLEEGIISGITGHPLGGLYQIHFEDGRVAHLQSGMGARQFVSVYGSLGNAVGKRIRYETDSLNVMRYFEPIEDD